jgi:hypothetical protein
MEACIITSANLDADVFRSVAWVAVKRFKEVAEIYLAL